MDELSRQYFADLQLDDADRRYEAYAYLLKETQEPVSWTYEVWDELVQLLGKGDHNQRLIAGQLLLNLAKSDPEKRVRRDLGKIMELTKDSRLATARQMLQGLWKIGIVDKELHDLIANELGERYKQSANEDHRVLFRLDIITNYRKLFDQFRDPAIKEKALALIPEEPDERSQRKYLGLWKRSE